MSKYKLSATIPTTQYGNYIPEIEIECELEELDEAKAIVFEHINKLWQQYAERPPTDNFAGGKVVDTFTGEQIIYNEKAHKYTDLKGNPLLSGSSYASGLKPSFNKEKALDAAEKKYDVEKLDLSKMWDLKGDIACEYGNALHHALELYHTYKEEGDRVSKGKGEELNYSLPSIPALQEVVLSFEKEFGVNALTEVFVSDVNGGRVGQIDRLEILDKNKKVCRIGDFKTNYDLTKKKIDNYQHQLSFYAAILIAHGWTVEGLDLFHYDGKWTRHQLEILPIK